MENRTIVFGLFLVPLLTLILHIGCQSESINDTSYPGKFHVEANLLVDAAGNEVVFRGIDPMDPLVMAFTPDWTNPGWNGTYYKIMSEWGAKIIRLPIHPYIWRSRGKDASLAVIDQVVEWVREQEMYIIIDFHSIGFPPTEEYSDAWEGIYLTSKNEIRNFWDIISKHYSENNVVAFYELFNEPVSKNVIATTGDWVLWKTFAEELIDIIRGNDPDSVVIVGGLQWAYDLSYVLLSPVERENIVYATHPYPGSEWHRSWEEAFGEIKNQYPVFATEFGFETEGYFTEDEYQGEERYRKAIISYLETKKISWSVWCFSVTWTPALLADRDFTPTEAGAFFRQKLLEKAE